MGSGHSNKVIGQSGEFAVCAQLGKLGLVATPFSGNVPYFDVIVSDDKLRTLPIQVKATFGNSTWIVGDARTWMDIDYCEKTGVQTIRGPKDSPHPELVMIYVWLSRKPGEADRFFVLTEQDVQGILCESYANWLAKHNGRRPRKPESYHLALGISEIAHFENNWELIKERLTHHNR